MKPKENIQNKIDDLIKQVEKANKVLGKNKQKD